MEIVDQIQFNIACVLPLGDKEKEIIQGSVKF